MSQDATRTDAGAPVPPRKAVCPGVKLGEGQYRKQKILFEGQPAEALIFRFNGQPYAYINRCVHMPRPLDGEEAQIFDASGKMLRCSMHGIVYTPESGTSVSALCEGQQLRSIETYEANGEVGFADFRIGAFLDD